MAKKGKWKGKDWYDILAPEEFGEKELGEVPATDPSSLSGRVIEVDVDELEGHPRLHMKVNFKIVGVENGKAKTTFNGCFASKGYLSKLARKRTEKVDVMVPVETKDGWKLRVQLFLILNRKTASQVETKVRRFVKEEVKKFAEGKTLKGLVNAVINTLLQTKIKKDGSKLYPVRTSEVGKVEVVKRPQ